MAVARRPVRRAREEEPEEERPRRSREKEYDEEPVEERPARRRSRDEEEEERPRRSRARDDDDEKPRRTASSVRKGWAGHKENASKGSDFAEDFKPRTKSDLIRFLQDEPFVSFRQHWIENPPNGQRKKSWTCLEEDCPLCDIGDRPRTLTGFNVLHITTGGDPEVKVWNVGVKVTKQLETFAEDPKTGPLTKHYWSVKRTGEGSSSVTNLQPVKERDLEDDWPEVDPLTEDDLDDALEQAYDESIVQIPPRSTLKDMARALSDD